MISGGKIDRRKAKSVFLVHSGRGDSADDYQLPLATIGENGEPQYQEKLLDDAFDHASGKYTGLANRSLQNSVIRLKRKAGHSLSSNQADFMQRHMSVGSRYYDISPTSEDIGSEILKYDAAYQAAIVALKRTLSGK